MPFYILAVLLLAVDQWSKYWTLCNLELGESAPFLNGFIELLRVHNYGAAWSSFSGMRWLLVGVTSIICIAILVLLLRKIVRHPLGVCACSLVLSGGFGNIIDRLRFGYVIDMLHFEFWPTYPVFNVADMCVVCGAILGSIYYLFYYEKYDQPKKVEESHDTDSSV
ncbi:signal peptidase II [Bengtsoniella intestinalis]|uniref:signal peptidase II n=1 Tax=Bengtsoniella intestinalis TaxID=3073143 RepID=UPI00391F122B